ncbi:MAG: hypothetical protein H3C48_04700 [Chitinophagaceae bacterium]|nr:hypothetical protein [Chitinophagaceae bacterium]
MTVVDKWGLNLPDTGIPASIEIYFTLTPENPALIQQLNRKEVSNE